MIGSGNQQTPTAAPASGGCGCIGNHLRPSSVRRSALYFTILGILLVLVCMTSITYLQTQILKTQVEEQDTLHPNSAFTELSAARSGDSEPEAENGGITKRSKLDTEKRETGVDDRGTERITGDDHIEELYDSLEGGILDTEIKRINSSWLSFNASWHPKQRKDRFPSVQERIRIYAGEDIWHHCACRSDTEGITVMHPDHPERIYAYNNNLSNMTVFIPSYLRLGEKHANVQLGRSTDSDAQLTMHEILRLDPRAVVVTPEFGREDVFILDRQAMQDCICTQCPTKPCYPSYCMDALQLLDFVHNKTELGELFNKLPIFIQFGDADTMWDIDLPVLKKFRRRLAPNAVARSSSHPTDDSYLWNASSYNLSAVPSSELCNSRIRPREYRSNRQEAFIWTFNTARHFGKVKDVIFHE